MKYSKLLYSLFIAVAISPLSSFANLSDDLDKNVTPSTLEEREEEAINSRDQFDANTTPSSLEEREKEEEVESDYIQGDDPEKVFEPADQEFDEEIN